VVHELGERGALAGPGDDAGDVVVAKLAGEEEAVEFALEPLGDTDRGLVPAPGARGGDGDDLVGQLAEPGQVAGGGDEPQDPGRPRRR
jgi:hypothetical protein